MEEDIIGIDLGTSNSSAAIVIAGRATIIPSSEGVSAGGKTIPSVVAFTDDGMMIVGEAARRQATMNSEKTVSGIKRYMGTNHVVSILGKNYKPQEISAFILSKIKKDAEAFLGRPVKKAVITVPAYFNDAQRQATKDAGAIAGLEVVRLINEPTAASFAYGIDKEDKEMNVLVFDLGGGTFDVTIMDFGGGVFRVLSSSGDTKLGGVDMDAALVAYILETFKKDTGIDCTNDTLAMQRISEAAERAKIELSTLLETTINLPFIAADANGPQHLVLQITRSKLESLLEDIIEKLRVPVTQALTDAGFDPQKIDKVILVGGPTRMPAVQKFVEDYFGKKAESGIDAMECVAVGAAIQGAVISGAMNNIILVDVTPLTLGVETLGGVFTEMVKRNTAIPVKRSQVFTTASDDQKQVEIHVLQGERPLARDNMSLGRFVLDDILPAPRGIPQIEVTYEIDANGMTSVSAINKITGKQQHITIDSVSRLTKEDIKSMQDEAAQFDSVDEQKRKDIETKNKADAVLYKGKKIIEKLVVGSVEEKLLKDVEDSLNQLETLIKENDIVAINEQIEMVTSMLVRIQSAPSYHKKGK